MHLPLTVMVLSAKFSLALPFILQKIFWSIVNVESETSVTFPFISIVLLRYFESAFIESEEYSLIKSDEFIEKEGFSVAIFLASLYKK